MAFPTTFTAGHVVTAAELEAMRSFGDPFATYAVAWGSTGTAPTIGNGTLTGRYTTYGQLVKGRIELSVGSTTSAGTGTYTFSLPSPAANISRGVIGSAMFFDTSASALYDGVAYRSSTSTSLISVVVNNVQWTATAPVAPANGDVISVLFEYEAA